MAWRDDESLYNEETRREYVVSELMKKKNIDWETAEALYDKMSEEGKERWFAYYDPDDAINEYLYDKAWYKD